MPKQLEKRFLNILRYLKKYRVPKQKNVGSKKNQGIPYPLKCEKKMFSNIPENLNVQYAKTPLRKQNLITVNAIDKNKSEKNIWGCSLI